MYIAFIHKFKNMRAMHLLCVTNEEYELACIVGNQMITGVSVCLKVDERYEDSVCISSK